MRVRLYGTLRDAVGANRVPVTVPRDGTVGGALTDLCRQFPALKPRLFDDDGALQPYVLVAVSGKDIRDGGGLDHPVGSGDEIAIFPPSAGG